MNLALCHCLMWWPQWYGSKAHAITLYLNNGHMPLFVNEARKRG